MKHGLEELGNYTEMKKQKVNDVKKISDWEYLPIPSRCFAIMIQTTH